MRHFVKKLKEEGIILFGGKVIINEGLIGEVTGLSIEGMKFFRDRKISDEAVMKFPKSEEEREVMVKVSNSYFEANTIKNLGREVFRVVMEYITMDERFTRVYDYQFILLNHFKYKVKVYFPHYILCSLKHYILEHHKSPRSAPILHVDLIQLILENFASLPTPSNPIFPLESDGYGMETSMSRGNSDGDLDWEEELSPPPKKMPKKSSLSRPLGKLETFA